MKSSCKLIYCHCGNLVVRSVRKRSKFCSDECSTASPAKTYDWSRGRRVEYVTRVCVICGKRDEFPPSIASQLSQTTCSRECKKEYHRRENFISTPCEWCKELFTQPKLKTRQQRFCSRKCAARWVGSQPETRARASANMSRSLLDPSSKLRAAIVTRANSDANPFSGFNMPKELRSERSKLNWRKAASTMSINRRRTSPEVQMLSGLLPPHRLEHLVSFAPWESKPTCAFLDIAFPETKLAVEVDGGVHHRQDRKAADAIRTERLTTLGWTVIRFWNSEVWSDTGACAAKVLLELEKLSKSTA